MKQSRILFFLLGLILIGNLEAKNCRSKLGANMHDINDRISVGVELRSFYYGQFKTDYFKPDNEDIFLNSDNVEHNFMSGIRPAFEISILENLYLTGEFDFRFKYPDWGWEDNAISGFGIRMNEVFLGADISKVNLNLGIMTWSYPDAITFDQRFLGMNTNLNTKALNVSVFGGLINPKFIKNNKNCLWSRYTKPTEFWKYLKRGDQNYAGGLKLSYKKLKPYRLQLLTLLSMPEKDFLKSLSFDLNFAGYLIKRKLRLNSHFLMYIDNDKNVLPGLFAGFLVKPFEENLPWLELNSVISFRDDISIDPLYENLDFGIIKRYSIHDGNLLAIKLNENPNEKLEFFADMFLQSSDFKYDESNELDLGGIINFKETMSLKLAYIGMDFGNERKLRNSSYLEFRYIF